MANGVSKNLFLHTGTYSYFKNAKVDLSNMCTQNFFGQKTVLPSEKLAKSQKNRFLGKNFFGYPFMKEKMFRTSV
jgi:hypothetical protein